MNFAKNSFWLADALGRDLSAAPQLRGDVSCDIAIVGGGYCGLWAALALKAADPSLEIIILEKDICGAGASGRNAGYVLSWAGRLPALTALCGVDEASSLVRASMAAVDEIEEFCRQHRVAEFRRSGWLWAATCDAHVGAWRNTQLALDAARLPKFEQLTGRQISSRWGLDGFKAGVLDPSSGTVHPAQLALALRRTATESGIRIFERTPMNRFRRRGFLEVTTPYGCVRPKKLILAMNAWMGAMREFRSSILVAASELATTRPVPEIVEAMGWTYGPVVNDARLMVGAIQARPDGRIVFGKGGGKIGYRGVNESRFTGPAPRLRLMEAEFHRYSSAFSNLKAEQSWIGPVDRTRDALPLFGYLNNNKDIIYACGFSGNGVGPTRLAARFLKDLALEQRTELTSSALIRGPTGGFPPEPFRQIGGRLVLRAVHRKDVLQHAGKRVGATTNFLAGLAPATLVVGTKARKK